MKNKIISTLALLSFVGAIAATSQAQASTISSSVATRNAYTSHVGAMSSSAQPQMLPYWHYLAIALVAFALAAGSNATEAHAGATPGDALFDGTGS